MKTKLHSSNIMFPELSYSIVEVAMDVHNEMLPGWDEWDYHRAMISALESKGHAVDSHGRKVLVYREQAVAGFELNLLVDDRVVLELKHLKEGFHPSHYTQIINSLKCWGKPLGMLINFGQEQLRYQRVPYSPQDLKIETAGCWDVIHKQTKELVATAAKNILADVGLGYSADVFSALIWIELKYLNASCERVVSVPEFSGEPFEEREVNALIVGKRLMITISASSSATDLSYLKTYMKGSGIQDGILINLDHPKIELRGVR